MAAEAADRIEVAAGLPPGPTEHDDLAPAGLGERWLVLYTRSRCEKVVARVCARLRARHYLALREHETGRDRRGRRYLVPLFPSYVFACLSYRTQLELLATGVIARVIPVLHPEILLAELGEIRRVLEAGTRISVVAAMPRGTRVRVIRGALAGVEGLIVGSRHRHRRQELVLNVTVLGRAVLTTIDTRDIEVAAAEAGLPLAMSGEVAAFA
jgi:transcription antitermination factor NusG